MSTTAVRTKINKTAETLQSQRSSGCGGRIRTCDLRVMSPTSYQLLHSAVYNWHKGVAFLVLVAGLEPARLFNPTDFKSVASASSATRAGRFSLCSIIIALACSNVKQRNRQEFQRISAIFHAGCIMILF